MTLGHIALLQRGQKELCGSIAGRSLETGSDSNGHFSVPEVRTEHLRGNLHPSPTPQVGAQSDVLRSVLPYLGTPDIDVFTNRDNSKCTLLCEGKTQNPWGMVSSSLGDTGFFYLSPPLPLILSVLLKLQ